MSVPDYSRPRRRVLMTVVGGVVFLVALAIAACGGRETPTSPSTEQPASLTSDAAASGDKAQPPNKGKGGGGNEGAAVVEA